jgi:hypothetical protein
MKVSDLRRFAKGASMQRPEKGNLSCSGCGPRLAGASTGDLTMETIQARFSSWPDIVLSPR